MAFLSKSCNDPLLEEHIRLVDKNDVFPRSGNIKDPLKGTIKTHSRTAVVGLFRGGVKIYGRLFGF
jgi:hypothetical protein